MNGKAGQEGIISGRSGLARGSLAVGLVILLFVAVGLARDPSEGGDGRVAFTILHLNDVYELTPVSGGKEGGLARVAAIRAGYVERNPNTLTILAGDLLNPSALSTAVVDGERLAGRQMVDVMNRVGLDYATFGNHEFDLDETALRARLSESEFTWLSSNVSDASGQPFPDVPRQVVHRVTDADGDEITLGFFGVTVASNPAEYVDYRDPFEAAAEQVAKLRPQVDVLIAITHLQVEDDAALARTLPEIDLVLGGHEHENHELYRGIDFTPILKADANARSMQVHEVVFDLQHGFGHNSTLRRVTDADPEDPAVAGRVDIWVQAAFEGFRDQGFDPDRLVTATNEDLDGRESEVRNRPTRLTELIAAGMQRSASAEVAIFNSGSIRIDDVIPAGPVTEYDVIRALPFGGEVLGVEMTGELLNRVLSQGRVNAGTGGYLQTGGATFDGGWTVGESPLDPGATYRVAVNDFLLSGNEIELDFLTRDAPGLTVVDSHGDIREVLISELVAAYGAP